MLALAHTALSRDWVTYVSILSGVAATWLTLYFLYVRPLFKDREKEREERAKAAADRKKSNDAFIYGVAGVPGVTVDVPPAAIRMQAVEQGLHSNTQELKRMGDWQKAANGTARETKALAEETRDLVSKLVVAGLLVQQSLDAQGAREVSLQSSLDGQDAREKLRQLKNTK